MHLNFNVWNVHSSKSYAEFSLLKQYCNLLRKGAEKNTFIFSFQLYCYQTVSCHRESYFSEFLLENKDCQLRPTERSTIK